MSRAGNSKRLWEKGEGVHAQVHHFTVGTDPEIDRRLVEWDAIGSAAHVRMLAQIGIVSGEECGKILAELESIAADAKAWNFTIPEELEDCHTTIEARLIEKLGDFAGKIHTGRSRNDQVALDVRLYIREESLAAIESLIRIAEAFGKRFNEFKDYPMPGYTHLQPAMPASVGMWLHAFDEWTLELVRDGLSVLERINSNPLGTASGFGVPLPLDRNMVAKLLSFSANQRSPIDTQNSRGRYELKFVRLAADIAAMIEKFSQDLHLFSMREFGFFALPDDMTTGSSIMPQKHNPDVLELLRGSGARIRAAEHEIQLVIAKLPSSYHRDFQLVKEPMIHAAETLRTMLPIVEQVVLAFRANQERLKGAMTDELYVTYDAFRQVRSGIPFREAYRKTVERMRTGAIDYADLRKDFSLVAQTIAASMNELTRELEDANRKIQEWRSKLNGVAAQIFRQ